ncbi:hypothetical protein [Modicisalibacter sp. MOD 31.J]|uniref:hypothetical protein n=1 Tax=Modicisalibacter sp. MOD 31.J TaxID=2831897 RepID=UPI001CCFFA1B|nr:hypothetical protein [Modicisalibacter sp. MOD 31.J]MBZ9576754.1 hypothetical protein [Modicisalibacter sp. MOD 31.J]
MASIHHLPTPSHASPAVEPDRGEWGALRAELHARAEDRDLAALWADLAIDERRVILGSARLDRAAAVRPLDEMAKPDRDAIRAAIVRMSGYARRLRERLEGERPHPSRDLAAHARQALAEGNTEAALHWLSLIERGVA